MGRIYDNSCTLPWSMRSLKRKHTEGLMAWLMKCRSYINASHGDDYLCLAKSFLVAKAFLHIFQKNCIQKHYKNSKVGPNFYNHKFVEKSWNIGVQDCVWYWRLGKIMTCYPKYQVIVHSCLNSEIVCIIPDSRVNTNRILSSMPPSFDTFTGSHKL